MHIPVIATPDAILGPEELKGDINCACGKVVPIVATLFVHEDGGKTHKWYAHCSWTCYTQRNQYGGCQ